MTLNTKMSSRRMAVFTVDVEQDISKYIKNGYAGMERGLPKILGALKEHDIRGTFFWTGGMAKKYPDLFKRCIADGHEIGCHGLDHSIEYYNRESTSKQEKDIAEAKLILEAMSGKKITSFRAPNFSLGGSTLEVIERQGFTVDSSVMPGRLVRKWRIFTLLDFRNAPFSPYRPSESDILVSGDSKVIEMPPAMNPETPGSPIGLGLLNARGKEVFLKACEKSSVNPLILLSHPWEAVKLDAKHCPGWVHRACREDIEAMKSTLIRLQEGWDFVTLGDAVEFLF